MAALDGAGELVRMTRFSEFAGFGANNPVVSPNCRSVLFGRGRPAVSMATAADSLVYDLTSSPGTPADLCAPGDAPQK